MDESYFVYGEEADWCWRLRRAGWRCVFAPVGRILHVDGGNKSTDQASVRMYVQMQKNVLLFQRLNLSRASWLASRALFLTLSPVRWIARAILARLTHDPTARHRAAQCGAALRFHWTGQEPTS